MTIGKLCGTFLGKSRVLTNAGKLNPANLRLDTNCLECMSNGTYDLMQMGVSRSDARMLLRYGSKNEIIEGLKIYDQAGTRKQFLEALRAETSAELQAQRELWGRELNLGKEKLVYNKEACEQDIMTITSKWRAEKNFKNGQLKCKELPEEVKMTAEDLAAKEIVDRGFAQLPRMKHDMMQYRGEVISASDPWAKKVSSLKEGEIFEMPGYAWTTDSKKYAFGNYSGDGALDFIKTMNRMSIKYHVLCPEGTKIMASRSRMGQEFVMPCDSKMRLVKKVVDKENNTIELFCEHIPDKSLNHRG